MQSFFYGADSGKEDFFEACIQDPLTDVGGNLWPLLTDLPESPSSALTGVPGAVRNALSCVHEAQGETAQVSRRRSHHDSERCCQLE